eukprot:10149711-Alexandrium_andersonii.AAC.1
MSASLVGSEMCIRDRICAACTMPHVLCEWPCTAGPLQIPQREHGGRSNSCLLYTSDAADDM